jgi:hypothetical protein
LLLLMSEAAEVVGWGGRGVRRRRRRGRWCGSVSDGGFSGRPVCRVGEKGDLKVLRWNGSIVHGVSAYEFVWTTRSMKNCELPGHFLSRACWLEGPQIAYTKSISHSTGGLRGIKKHVIPLHCILIILIRMILRSPNTPMPTPSLAFNRSAQ